ncbi:hypothetical protein FACS189442_1190 [Spirochaetia bacterium]|nr:hypothetical protein FACS189442_1190 [Spirochaetia bacterium]
MRKLYSLLACFTLIFTSCPPYYNNNNTGDKEPPYNKNIVWSFEIESRGNWAENFYHDGYAYIQESSNYMGSYAPKTFWRLLKVRLDDGQVMWKTLDMEFSTVDNFIVHNNYVYVPHGGYLYVYNDNDGALAATVFVGGQGKDMYSHYMIGCNSYIFWGNINRDSPGTTGLIRFDTRDIDFSQPDSTLQTIDPDLVWVSPDDKAIRTNFVEENGTVYFLTANRDYNIRPGDGCLVAIDAETLFVKWRKDLSHTDGFRQNSLVLNGDYLHVIDMAPSCYNKNTGAVVYENEFVDMTIEYKISLEASPYLTGITLHDNKLYYTTGMHRSTYQAGIPKELIKNIICMEPVTGNYVWGDLVPDGGTIRTFPVVVNGKAVIATDNGLRVYDAKTGKLLGVDKTIKNRGEDANYGYNNLFIFIDLDHCCPV